jgi:integrase
LLKKLLNELEFRQVSLHGLRHTYASVLLYQNVSIHYVSERLDHSDIETTLKEYTHVLKELRLQEEQNATEIFEKMIV